MVTKAKALWLLRAGSLFLAAGCAHEVVRQPATLAAAPSSEVVEVQQEVEIALDSGYSRRLMRSSRWTQAGTLPQGQAYKSVGGVFTVEGAHVHEAWLVVSGGELVGFYLPVEKAFVPQSARARIEFKPVSP
jgi:hypothetical protein